MDKIDIIKGIFIELSKTMENNKDLLTELDSAMGDGDLGITMSTGFKIVEEKIKFYEQNDISELIIKSGLIMAEAIPSTMGTLIASGLMEAGVKLKGSESFGLYEINLFLWGLFQGIQKRGKAKVGEKTILDSLYPACEALETATSKKQSLNEGLKNAYLAAYDGMTNTSNLKSVHGRASWYQNNSIGKQDPGATVGMLFVKAIADFFKVLD